MSTNFHSAHPVATSAPHSGSKKTSPTLGKVARPAAVFAAASALMLGVGVSAHASAVSDPTAPAPASAPVPAPASTWPEVIEPAVPAESSARTVQPGDTLSSIAATYGTGLESVLSQNGLSIDSIIHPGQIIIISDSGNAVAPAAVATAPKTAPGSLTAPATVLAVESAPTPAVGGPADAEPAEAESTVTTASMGVTETPATSTNAAILDSAKAQLGAGQDCTVLGEQALEAAGVGGVGDESPAGLMEFATPVSNPQPGDFIYYEDGGAGVPHNAVYIGDGQAIHSGFNGGQTVVNSADLGSGPSYYRVDA